MANTWQQLRTQLLIGTYTRDKSSEGIYLIKEDGEIGLVTEADNPSYLIRHPGLDVIYCVNETSDFSDQNSHGQSSTGAISAYQKSDLGAEGLFLDMINQQASLGADPCHLTIPKNGQYLAVSNYSGGTFATFSLEADGYIETFQSLTSHTGSGPVVDRQESAHVHSSLLINDQLYVADLGADRVSRYEITASGEITGKQSHITCAPGAGPRFLGSDGRKLYVINELDNTLSSYDLETLSLIQTISVVPENQTSSIAAHLAISEDNRFLYLSNRGFDSLVVVELEPTLVIKQTVSSGGGHPRHFCLTPDENYLIVANQDSDNLVVFERDSESGCLTSTGIEADVPCPTCVLAI